MNTTTAVNIVCLTFTFLPILFLLNRCRLKIREIAERFLLDALPMKQAVLKAEQHEGKINAAELKARMSQVQAEADFLQKQANRAKKIFAGGVVCASAAGLLCAAFFFCLSLRLDTRLFLPALYAVFTLAIILLLAMVLTIKVKR